MPRKLSPLEKTEKEAKAWGRRHKAPVPTRFYIDEDGTVKPHPLTEEQILRYDAENGIKYHMKDTTRKLINAFQPAPFWRKRDPIPVTKENENEKPVVV
ncbi:hypothetical protein MP638_004267 [Amoeboaphelidium occidentale]|nr:hypothetical protein MP638_004267 [Amoeboaphelidium occidentale]